MCGIGKGLLLAVCWAWPLELVLRADGVRMRWGNRGGRMGPLPVDRPPETDQMTGGHPSQQEEGEAEQDAQQGGELTYVITEQHENHDAGQGGPQQHGYDNQGGWLQGNWRGIGAPSRLRIRMVQMSDTTAQCLVERMTAHWQQIWNPGTTAWNPGAATTAEAERISREAIARFHQLSAVGIVHDMAAAFPRVTRIRMLNSGRTSSPGPDGVTFAQTAEGAYVSNQAMRNFYDMHNTHGAGRGMHRGGGGGETAGDARNWALSWGPSFREPTIAELLRLITQDAARTPPSRVRGGIMPNLQSQTDRSRPRKKRSRKSGSPGGDPDRSPGSSSALDVRMRPDRIFPPGSQCMICRSRTKRLHWCARRSTMRALRGWLECHHVPCEDCEGTHVAQVEHMAEDEPLRIEGGYCARCGDDQARNCPRCSVCHHCAKIAMRFGVVCERCTPCPVLYQVTARKNDYPSEAILATWCTWMGAQGTCPICGGPRDDPLDVCRCCPVGGAPLQPTEAMLRWATPYWKKVDDQDT